MRKLKIYLETSVISYLDQLDAPKEMDVTHKLWERVKAGVFDVVLSYVVFFELAKCAPKKSAIFKCYLAQIQYEHVEVNDDMLRIADIMVDLKYLAKRAI